MESKGLENLHICGFGNPLLDISAVVEQKTLDECARAVYAHAAHAK